METMTHRTRCAVVGTAESWKACPWTDPTLHIVSLNDAYSLGLPRADEWYDIHSLDKMVFRPAGKKVDPRTVPPGSFVRPDGHLDWLKAQAATIPVWLQDEPPAGWPVNAQRFPVEQVTAKYGTYWASGPAFIVMHLYERGFREFHIYGIHLATQHEYVEQKPNWEHLLGRLLGPDVTMTAAKGLRTYDGATTGVRIVLPESCPILQHGWTYAYEPKPIPPVDPYMVELKAVRKEALALARALVTWPTGKDKSRPLARLERLDVIALDIQQQMAKRRIGGTLVAKLAAA